MWGTIGIFFSLLHFDYGLSALTIAFLRALFSAVALIVALGLCKPTLLRLDRHLMVYYVLFGLFGIASFYVLNIQAVILTNVATASVLLYTAPVFVTLLAWWLWREPLTPRKIGAVLAAFVGCTLVAKGYDPSSLRLNAVGVLVGAAAGLAYSLFTIFSKLLSARSSPWTTSTYALFFGALFLLPLQFISLPQIGASDFDRFLTEPAAWLVMAGLCLGPTLGSYALYNAGLQTVPASNASVVATIEPVVASLAGFGLFGQVLEPPQILGAAIIIVAALSLSRQSRAKPQPEAMVGTE